MTTRRAILAVSLLAILLPGSPSAAGDDAAAAAAHPVLAVVGARLLPVSGAPIPDGTILIHRGKIRAVGPRDRIEVPEGAEVVDASGLVACPGFLDARTGLFLAPGESSRPSNQADVRALDGVDPFDRSAPAVLRAGVTAVFVSPPPASGVNGAGAVLRVRPGRPGELAVDGAGTLCAALGVSRRSDPGPVARIGEVGRILGALRSADGYRRTLEKHEKALAAYEKALKEWKKKEAERKKEAEKKGEKERGAAEPVRPDPPRPNPAAKALLPVLARRAILRVHVDDAESILDALTILDDYDVRLVLEGLAEAGRVIPALRAAKVPVVPGPLLADDPDDEVDPALARELSNAGLTVAIASFSPSGRGSRHLALHAAAAVAAGLPRETALRAITLDAARIMGVDRRKGSLEAAKDADLVLLDGDPLDTRSRVVRVFVGGEEVER